MTDGILLAEIQSDRWLSAYDTIIVDEAHERSLNIDFLLGYLKQLLPKRRDLKVIVTSATIDTARFSQHFDDAPVVDVEGRGYPVEVRYRPLEGEGDEEAGALASSTASSPPATRSPQGSQRGDVLVFLPGEREIRDAHQALERRKYRAHRSAAAVRAAVGARPGPRVPSRQPAPHRAGDERRRNLADGAAHPLRGRSGHWRASSATARGRSSTACTSSRCRRPAPTSARAAAGASRRACATASMREADFESRSAYTDPEIRRAALAGVILRMLSLGLGRIEDFPFLEPPDPRAVADGWQTLARTRRDRRRAQADDDRPHDGAPAGRREARRACWSPRNSTAACARCWRSPRSSASRIRASGPPTSARRPTTRMRSSPIRDRSSSASSSCGRRTAIAHEELDAVEAAQMVREAFPRLPAHARVARAASAAQAAMRGAGLGSGCNGNRLRSDDASMPRRYATLHRALIAGLPTQIGQRTERGVYDGAARTQVPAVPGLGAGEETAARGCCRRRCSTPRRSGR